MSVLSEVSLFSVLLVLVSVQVVVYWSCSREITRDQLKYDEGQIKIHNDYISPHGENKTNFTVRAVSENCYKCNYTFICAVAQFKNCTFIVDTTHPVTVHILKDGQLVCNISRHFLEKSMYFTEINYNSSPSVPYNTECITMLWENSNSTYLPILYATVTLCTVALLWLVLVFLHRYLKEKGHLKSFHLNLVDRLTHRDLGLPMSPESGTKYGVGGVTGERHPILNSSYNSNIVQEDNEGTVLLTNQSINVKLEKDVAISKRLTSLDTFRGLSLVIMIFVNYGGGGYWFFQHSKWNGLTVADLVFPWFVWIMGVSLVFSFRGKKKDSLLQKLYQICRRTVILFALGLFLSSSSDVPLTHIRIPGVLQRFSITYLIVALTELGTGYLYHRINFSFWTPLKDITNNCVQWVLVILMETLWLMFTFLLSTNGCPRGYLGAGGKSDSGMYPNCTGGAAGDIDRWILGNNHIYNSSTAKDLYDLKLNYDPEGILGTLNSIVLCYFGVQAGRTFLHFRGNHIQILVRLIVWGVVLSVLGTVLSLGQKNDGFIPLNKNLWSLSFILVMGGTGYLVLALFYLMVDVVHLWNGSPFRYQGMNSIVLYVGHEILSDYFPFGVYNQDRTHLTYLASNIVAVTIWMLISYYWYTLRFFVKI